MEANKDQSLARRIQRLQRFLLDKVHHEILKRQDTEVTGQDSASKTYKEQAATSEIADAQAESSVEVTEAGHDWTSLQC